MMAESRRFLFVGTQGRKNKEDNDGSIFMERKKFYQGMNFFGPASIRIGTACAPIVTQPTIERILISPPTISIVTGVNQLFHVNRAMDLHLDILSGRKK